MTSMEPIRVAIMPCLMESLPQRRTNCSSLPEYWPVGQSAGAQKNCNRALRPWWIVPVICASPPDIFPEWQALNGLHVPGQSLSVCEHFRGNSFEIGSALRIKILETRLVRRNGWKFVLWLFQRAPVRSDLFFNKYGEEPFFSGWSIGAYNVRILCLPPEYCRGEHLPMSVHHQQFWFKKSCFRR